MVRVRDSGCSIRAQELQKAQPHPLLSIVTMSVVHILLEGHETVNLSDDPDNYLHLLVLAVTKGKSDTARLLQEAGAILQDAERRYKALNGDVKRNLFERALVANRAEPGTQPMQDYYSFLLWVHVKNNDIETVALLLQVVAREIGEDLPNRALGWLS